MKLPTQFDVGGSTVKVMLKDQMSREGAHGLARYDECEMWLDSKLTPSDLRGITFYHELMHFIFNTIGKNHLRDDEELVDSVGNLLWQAHKTMVFNKGKK